MNQDNKINQSNKVIQNKVQFKINSIMANLKQSNSNSELLFKNKQALEIENALVPLMNQH